MPDGSNVIALRQSIQPAIDRTQLEPFLQRLQAVAGEASGNFVVTGFGDAPGSFEKLTPLIYVVPNGPKAVTRMIKAIEEIGNRPGYNVYVSRGFFKDRAQWA